MKYSEKLRDPRWQRKRLEVMDRDNFACLACGDASTTLNVHHKEYHGNPWDASTKSLETLCESCHEKRTVKNKEFLSLSTKKALKVKFQERNLSEYFKETARFLQMTKHSGFEIYDEGDFAIFCSKKSHSFFYKWPLIDVERDLTNSEITTESFELRECYFFCVKSPLTNRDDLALRQQMIRDISEGYAEAHV